MFGLLQSRWLRVGGFGAQAAAPIARQVFDYYLTGKVTTAPAPPVPASAVSDDESD